MTKAVKDKKLCEERSKFIYSYLRHCNHCGTKTPGDKLFLQEGLCSDCYPQFLKTIDSFRRK